MKSEVKIVVIGGGTGLSVLLRGLKKVTNNITAVVAVSDDGGGSGVLREDLGMLPPGDIRSCILALSNKEPILQELFQYRFNEGRLKNQNFGNLMIAAMTGISENFEEAVKKISDIFAITGKVLPVTTDDIELIATLEDGTRVVGESNIPYSAVKKKSKIKSLSLTPPDAKVLPEVIEEIKEADVVVIGPGSLYTSIISNLLLEELREAIRLASGRVVYIGNVMTQLGETDGFGLREHIQVVETYLGSNVIDTVYANNGAVASETLTKYAIEEAKPVVVTPEDEAYCLEKAIELIQDDFVEIKKGYLRHDAEKLAKRIVQDVDIRLYIH
ncbi:MAG: YvcK family protein [Clostridia bacterium]|nr:YvcK family protein [Clostridia bacterium]